MIKRKTKNLIKLLKIQKFESAKIVIDIDDDLYEAMAEAGRRHIEKDKMACFTYALNKSLSEMCRRLNDPV